MEQEQPPIPPISSSPTDQHGQVMFVLGQLMGEMKGVQARQDLTNGKVLKAGIDIVDLQNRQSEQKGESKGVDNFWYKVSTAISTAVAIIALALKFLK